MPRALPRFLILLLFFLPVTSLSAEKVADLPIPTRYVNDFAGVLTPDGAQRIEDLSLQVHQKAHAELVVATIKTLDDNQSIEDFTVQLEEKWKLGKKGEDRSALMVLVLNPRRLRIETGYGLEGMLNDAKVGAILDNVRPFARTGDYDQAMMTGVQGLARVIAADSNVVLTETAEHRYHREVVQPAGLSVVQVVATIGFILLIIILVSTGHIGWAWLLLSSVMGGGGGGRGGGDDERGGGGFGGVGGGGSGGGGASRDF